MYLMKSAKESNHTNIFPSIFSPRDIHHILAYSQDECSLGVEGVRAGRGKIGPGTPRTFQVRSGTVLVIVCSCRGRLALGRIHNGLLERRLTYPILRVWLDQIVVERTSTDLSTGIQT
jgi:hypothetical protein